MVKIIVIGVFEQSRIHKILSSSSEFEVVGLGNDGYDAIRLIDSKEPDIVVLTSYLKNNEDRKIISLIKSKSPQTSVILLIACKDERRICNSITYGASAYLLEDDMDDLCPTVNKVYHGYCFMSVRVTTKVLPLLSQMRMGSSHPVENKSQATLTVLKIISSIELHIMILVTIGLSTEDIAENLHVAPGTVRNYISLLMRKIGVKNRNQIGIFALKNELLSLSEIE
jgi:DNA-binding NarL/FixJ family response regulator